MSKTNTCRRLKEQNVISIRSFPFDHDLVICSIFLDEETPVFRERPLVVPSPDSPEIPSSRNEPVSAAGAETPPESSQMDNSFTDHGDNQIFQP